MKSLVNIIYFELTYSTRFKTYHDKAVADPEAIPTSGTLRDVDVLAVNRHHVGCNLAHHAPVIQCILKTDNDSSIVALLATDFLPAGLSAAHFQAG